MSVGIVAISPAKAVAPVMSKEQKHNLGISLMKPKDYARLLVQKNFKQPSKEFKCLAQLWGKESAWNYKAKSPTHDYGIPQRHMKRNTKAQIADFMDNPHTQIRWGVNYIKTRYQTPCGALESWLSRSENGRGGWY